MTHRIRTVCPQCHHELRVREEYLGGTVLCKHCNSSFATKIPIVCGRCRHDLHVRPNMINQTVICNHCTQTFTAKPSCRCPMCNKRHRFLTQSLGEFHQCKRCKHEFRLMVSEQEQPLLFGLLQAGYFERATANEAQKDHFRPAAEQPISTDPSEDKGDDGEPGISVAEVVPEVTGLSSTEPDDVELVDSQFETPAVPEPVTRQLDRQESNIRAQDSGSATVGPVQETVTETQHSLLLALQRELDESRSEWVHLRGQIEQLEQRLQIEGQKAEERLNQVTQELIVTSEQKLALQSQDSTAQAQINQLRTEVEKWTSENATLRGKLSQLTEEVETFKTASLEKNKVAEEWNVQREQLRQQLVQQAQQAEAEQLRLGQELTSLREQHAAGQQALANLEKLTSENATLRGKLSQLTEEVETFKTASQEKNKVAEEWNVQREQLRQQLVQQAQQAEAEQLRLGQELTSLREQHATDQQALADLEKLTSENATLRDKLSQLAEEVETFKTASLEKDKVAEEWNVQREQLRQQLVQQAQQAETEQLRLGRELTSLREQHATDQQALADLEKLTNENATLRDKLSQLTEEVETFKTASQEKDKVAEEWNVQREQLRQQLVQQAQQAETEQLRLGQELTSLREQHATDQQALLAERNQLIEQQEEAQSELSSLQQRLDAAKQQVEQLTDSSSQQQAQFQAIQDERDSLETQLVEIREQLEQAAQNKQAQESGRTQQFEELRRQMESERVKLGEQQKQLEQQLHEANEQRDLLQTRLAQAGEAATTFQQTAHDLQQRLTQQSAEKNELAETLEQLRQEFESQRNTLQGQINLLEQERDELHAKANHYQQENEELKTHRPEGIEELQRAKEDALSQLALRDELLTKAKELYVGVVEKNKALEAQAQTTQAELKTRITREEEYLVQIRLLQDNLDNALERTNSQHATLSKFHRQLAEEEKFREQLVAEIERLREGPAPQQQQQQHQSSDAPDLVDAFFAQIGKQTRR